MPEDYIRNNMTGYDPNWFMKLPKEIQRIANQQRADLGLPQYTTSRPLTYEESTAGTGLPSFGSLPTSMQESIRRVTGQAFAPYEELWKAQQQLEQLQQQPVIDIDAILARIPSAPAPPPTLSAAEAQARARAQLEPLYEETLEKALKEVDRSNIRRGFFGQLPGAALARSTAADIETRKAQAIGQLANQLVGQSESAAAQQQQLALQQRQQEISALLGALGAAQRQQESERQHLRGLLPYFFMTEAERQRLPLDWASTIGTVGDWGQQQTGESGAVPLRLLAQQRGLPVSYDAATGNIVIGNRTYTPQELEQMGGQLIGGTWYLPQSAPLFG